MIFGMNTSAQMPETWTPIDGVAIVKCMDADGDLRIVMAATDSLNQWEAVGMLMAACDVSRSMLASSFAPGRDSHDE